MLACRVWFPAVRDRAGSGSFPFFSWIYQLPDWWGRWDCWRRKEDLWASPFWNERFGFPSTYQQNDCCPPPIKTFASYPDIFWHRSTVWAPGSLCCLVFCKLDGASLPRGSETQRTDHFLRLISSLQRAPGEKSCGFLYQQLPSILPSPLGLLLTWDGQEYTQILVCSEAKTWPVFSIPELFLVDPMDVVYKTFLNREGFESHGVVICRAGLRGFWVISSVNQAWRAWGSGEKWTLSLSTPEETKGLPSDGELSISLPGPSSGVLCSCPHHFFRRLFCRSGDTFKWALLDRSLAEKGSPGCGPLRWSQGEGWPPFVATGDFSHFHPMPSFLEGMHPTGSPKEESDYWRSQT